MPVSDCSVCVCQTLEPLPVNALLSQRADETLHHAVLLRAVRRDKLLLQAIASHQRCVVARCENETVVAAQKERAIDTPQCPEAGDESFLKRGRSG